MTISLCCIKACIRTNIATDSSLYFLHIYCYTIIYCRILAKMLFNSISYFVPYSQVKKSTLNPNAKEFNPAKAPLPMVSAHAVVLFFPPHALTHPLMQPFTLLLMLCIIDTSLHYVWYLGEAFCNPLDSTAHTTEPISGASASSRTRSPLQPSIPGLRLNNTITGPLCAGIQTHTRCSFLVFCTCSLKMLSCSVGF